MSNLFSLRVLVWPLCILVIAGCGTRIGPATVDGTYLDAGGEVVNVIVEPLDAAVEAGLQALNALRAPIDGTFVDEDGAFILAAAPDGSPVRVRFIREGRGLTAVRIRTGALGYLNNEFSHQVHASIRDRLTHGTRTVSALASKTTPAEGSTRPVPADAGPRRPETPPPHPAPPLPVAAISPEEGAGSNTTVRASRPLRSKPSRPVPDAAIYFEKVSNLPVPSEMAKLEAIAAVLSANPSWSASLVGFADGGELAGGREDENEAVTVAESRALAVKFYLVGRGIAASRLTTVANGADEGFNATDAREARRVDIRLVPAP